jgi:hypothetical protein
MEEILITIKKYLLNVSTEVKQAVTILAVSLVIVFITFVRVFGFKLALLAVGAAVCLLVFLIAKLLWNAIFSSNQANSETPQDIMLIQTVVNITLHDLAHILGIVVLRGRDIFTDFTSIGRGICTFRLTLARPAMDLDAVRLLLQDGFDRFCRDEIGIPVLKLVSVIGMENGYALSVTIRYSKTGVQLQTDNVNDYGKYDRWEDPEF